MVLIKRMPCGPTSDETECNCGCTAYDERCAYWIKVYEESTEQVSPLHTCCKIQGR